MREGTGWESCRPHRARSRPRTVPGKPELSGRLPSLPQLLSCGCCNRLPQTGRLKTTEIYPHGSGGPGSKIGFTGLKSRGGQGRVPSGGSGRSQCLVWLLVASGMLLVPARGQPAFFCACVESPPASLLLVIAFGVLPEEPGTVSPSQSLVVTDSGDQDPTSFGGRVNLPQVRNRCFRMRQVEEACSSAPALNPDGKGTRLSFGKIES